MTPISSTKVQPELLYNDVSRGHDIWAGRAQVAPIPAHVGTNSHLRHLKGAFATITYICAILGTETYAMALVPAHTTRIVSSLTRSAGSPLSRVLRTRSKQISRSRKRQLPSCRAKGNSWEDAPKMDPFDERRMEAQGTHVINWYVEHE